LPGRWPGGHPTRHPATCSLIYGDASIWAGEKAFKRGSINGACFEALALAMRRPADDAVEAMMKNSEASIALHTYH
jgi:hypothetical protein